MKGGSLTRFKPDPQDGGGFVQELLKASVRGGLKGLKSGRGVRGRIRKAKEGATRSAKQAVKRKAYEVLDRNIKRKFHDIFATNESHLLQKLETRQI